MTNPRPRDWVFVLRLSVFVGRFLLPLLDECMGPYNECQQKEYAEAIGHCVGYGSHLCVEQKNGKGERIVGNVAYNARYNALGVVMKKSEPKAQWQHSHGMCRIHVKGCKKHAGHIDGRHGVPSLEQSPL